MSSLEVPVQFISESEFLSTMERLSLPSSGNKLTREQRIFRDMVNEHNVKTFTASHITQRDDLGRSALCVAAILDR